LGILGAEALSDAFTPIS